MVNAIKVEVKEKQSCKNKNTKGQTDFHSSGKFVKAQKNYFVFKSELN